MKRNVSIVSGCLGLLLLAAIRGAAAPASMSDLTITPTVIASFIAEGEQLKLVGLWRGSTGWRARAGSGGHSGSGGGGRDVTRQGFAYGDFTFDVEISNSTDVARIEILDAKRVAKNLADRFQHEVSLKEANVILVDNFDTKPSLVRTTRIDPAWAATNPFDLYSVIRRQPELVEFLQCDLFLADPMLQLMVPEYREKWMATHPCGAVLSR